MKTLALVALLAVVSCGKNNPFGERYKERQCARSIPKLLKVVPSEKSGVQELYFSFDKLYANTVYQLEIKVETLDVIRRYPVNLQNLPIGKLDVSWGVEVKTFVDTKKHKRDIAYTWGIRVFRDAGDCRSEEFVLGPPFVGNYNPPNADCIFLGICNTESSPPVGN